MKILTDSKVFNDFEHPDSVRSTKSFMSISSVSSYSEFLIKSKSPVNFVSNSAGAGSSKNIFFGTPTTQKNKNNLRNKANERMKKKRKLYDEFCEEKIVKKIDLENEFDFDFERFEKQKIWRHIGFDFASKRADLKEKNPVYNDWNYLLWNKFPKIQNFNAMKNGTFETIQRNNIRNIIYEGKKNISKIKNKELIHAIKSCKIISGNLIQRILDFKAIEDEKKIQIGIALSSKDQLKKNKNEKAAKKENESIRFYFLVRNAFQNGNDWMDFDEFIEKNEFPKNQKEPKTRKNYKRYYISTKVLFYAFSTPIVSISCPQIFDIRTRLYLNNSKMHDDIIYKGNIEKQIRINPVYIEEFVEIEKFLKFENQKINEIYS